MTAPASEENDLLAPCGHAEPQAASQLHGVCVFCWRDRAAALRAALAERTRERDEARELFKKSLRVLTCAFCGHEYPPGTPPTQHDALTAHVKVCEKHPLRIEMARAKSDAAACAECILGEESITDEVVEAAQRALEWSRS